MKVKTLKKIAIDGIYQDIVSSLSFSPENCSKKRKWENLSEGTIHAADEPSAKPPEKKRKINPTEEAVKELREKLDQYLVGTYNHVREQLCYLYNSHEVSDRPDLCLFLNCILNNSFSVLDFEKDHLHQSSILPLDDHRSPITIVNTAAQWCPSLRKIAFVIEPSELPLKSWEAQWIQSFAQFKFLAKLELTWLSSSDCIQFFTHLGSSCPNLKHLKLKQLPFQLDQQLALVLGKQTALIPLSVKEELWRSEGHLHLLSFAKEFDLAPMCQSLEYLSVSSETSASLQLSTYSSVFILRHFPLLKKMSVQFNSNSTSPIPVTTSFAIQLLHQISLSSEKVAEVTKITRRGLILKPTNNHLDKLNLKMVEGMAELVNVRNAKMMNAIVALCPLMDAIAFHEFENLPEADIISAQQLQSTLFGQLTQVRYITFGPVDAEYRKAILASLGSQLISLCFVLGKDFDLIELLPCTQLCQLAITKCEFKSTQTPIPQEAFLPALRSLHIQTCHDAPNLQELAIPSLTELRVHCSHFGLPEVSDLNWDDLPRLYPNLRDFILCCPCRSLTLDLVRRFPSQLPNLKSIELPLEMLRSNKERQLGDELATQLEQDPTSVSLLFTDMKEKDVLIFGDCCYQNEEEDVIAMPPNE